MEFSERLEYAMNRKGMKQIELSRKAGLAPGTVSNYIKGKYKAKDENIKKIANALGVNERWLHGDDAPIDVPDDYIYIETIEPANPTEMKNLNAFYHRLAKSETGRDELFLIDRYRRADPAIQKAVRKILDMEDAE